MSEKRKSESIIHKRPSKVAVKDYPQDIEVISILSDCDDEVEDDVNTSEQDNAVKKDSNEVKCEIISSDDEDDFLPQAFSTSSRVKGEDASSSDSDSENELESYKYQTHKPIRFFNNSKDIPVLSEDNPKLQEIFELCILKEHTNLICKKRPYGVKESSTFLIGQSSTKHPFDFDADDTIGPSIKKEFVRFYEVKCKSKSLNISTEVSPQLDMNGKVLCGIYKSREGSSEWVDTLCSPEHMFALIRRRAEDKRLKEKGSKLVRWITFIMPLSEYNQIYKKLKKVSQYKLTHDRVIVHYNYEDSCPLDIIKSHGNSKHQEATFRPSAHSFRLECKEKLATSNKPVRNIIDDFEARENMFIRDTDSSVPRNSRQLYNFKSNTKPKDNTKDELLSVLLMMCDQPENSNDCCSPLDDSQPFVRDFLLESGGQPMITLFLDQTLTDVERFCASDKYPNSPLAFDTTFNIGEYKFTQTTYKNLSLLQKSNGKHPWFPGPVLIHRRERKQDFSFFWNSVKRQNNQLKNVKIIGTDECEALSGGILSELDDAVHLLGIEHVQKNIEENLVNCNIPRYLHHGILNDIFGQSGLISSDTNDEFVEKLEHCYKRWSELESKSSLLKFTEYFKKHKEEKFRTKLIQFVRKSLSIDGEYRQNCIEWTHYMSKREIDAGIKNSHKNELLHNSIEKLKKRYLRMYRDSGKAIYGEGPYKLASTYSYFAIPYDNWMHVDNELERISVVERFFKAVPIMNYIDTTEKAVESNVPTKDGENATIQPQTDKAIESNAPTKDGENATIQPQTDKAVESNAPTKDGEKATIQPQTVEVQVSVPVEAEALNIPNDIIKGEALKSIFEKANGLLNKKGAITRAASNEPNMRTVKSSYETVPHIIKPRGKNKNNLECNCRIFNWHKLCHHTLAASVNIGICFEYLIEAKKKILQGKGSLTNAIESTRKLNEKGMKDNEVRKAAKNRRIKKNLSTSESPAKNDHQQLNNVTQSPKMIPPVTLTRAPVIPISSNSSDIRNRIQVQQPSQNSISLSQPVDFTNMQQSTQQDSFSDPFQSFLSQVNWSNPLLANSQPSPVFTQFPMPMFIQDLNRSSLLPESGTQWNSGQSPHPYEVVQKSKDVRKCYGCGQDFAAKYNMPPNNLIIKHVDRRIRGKNDLGHILYNADFTPTYYHFNKTHIMQKNPYFNGEVFIKATLAASVGSERLLLFKSTTGLTIKVVT